MKINSERSIRWGKAAHARYGSWSAVRRASRYEDGTYVLPEHVPDPEQERAQPAHQ